MNNSDTHSRETLRHRVLRSLFFLLCSLLLAEAAARALFWVGPLFRRAKGTDDSSQRIVWVKRHSQGQPFRLKILDLVVMARERIRWVSGRNQQRAEEVAAAILDELIKTTRLGRAVPVFVYLPVLQEITDPEEGLTQHEEFLARYCRVREVLCLFLRPRFREQISKGATFNTRSHWLAPEHLLAAQAMVDFIYERKLLGAGPVPSSKDLRSQGQSR